MSDNVRVGFVSVNELAEDGITCTGGYLALRISTNGVSADITAFKTPKEAKEALFDDIGEIISTHCSESEYAAIEAVLKENGGFYFYDNFIMSTDEKIQWLEKALPTIQKKEYGEPRMKAIKEFIDKANEILPGENSRITLQESLEELGVEVRICSECGKLMASGYCIGEGDAYYCTDECLGKNMTMEQFNKQFDNGGGDSYYTDWWE